MKKPKRKVFPCPKCGQKLRQSGEMEILGHVFPMFQCEDCVEKVKIFDEWFDCAFTFCLDSDGEPFDPAADEEPMDPESDFDISDN